MYQRIDLLDARGVSRFIANACGWILAIWMVSSTGATRAEDAAGVRIDVAVAPSGAAGFGDGSERWQLGVAIGAWRLPGGALSTEELYVKRPGLTQAQLRPLQDRLSGFALARLRLKAVPTKRRYPSGHERWEAELVSIEATPVSDRELVAWVDKMRKPVVVRDEVLGALTFDRALSCYQAERALGRARYELAIYIEGEPDASRDAAKIQTLRGIVTAVEAGVPRYREQAADKLLGSYNDEWRNDGDARLTRAQFVSRLTLESISLNPGGEIEVFFNDGDLFGGHVIHLRLDKPERVRSIDIAG